MKRFVLLLGVIWITLGLWSCMQDNAATATDSHHGAQFEIYLPDSRTENDGTNTIWSEGDNLSVFYAEGGSTAFNGNNKFVLTDPSTGRFSATLASELSADSYDWFAIYPYNESLISPGVGGYNTIGCTKSVGVQTQNGNNSSAHLCGAALPLVGATRDVAVGDSPVIRMRNAASFAQFTITNRLNEPISITTIEMLVRGYHLVGEFCIGFDEETTTYIPKEGGTLDTATLDVVDGETIAVGKSAVFYLAVAPFKLTESSEVAFKVTAQNATGAELICTKSVTCDAGWGFSEGKYKCVNFGFESLGGEEKTITLTKQDIINVGAEWSYADTYVREIESEEGPTWYAYQSARTSNGQTTVQLKATLNIGYLATPVVNGTITKVAITLKGSTQNAQFAIYDSDVMEPSHLLYTSEKLGESKFNTMIEYEIELSSQVSQLYIRSYNATIKIQSVTVYYE